MTFNFRRTSDYKSDIDITARTVEITSMLQLVEFVKENGTVVIEKTTIFNEEDKQLPPFTIEIYDDYRE